jgi:hypothetical protein
MITLDDLWQSVVKDKIMDIYVDDTDKYCIYKGCKITKTLAGIDIHNCNTGSDNFAKLSRRQLKPFLTYGFRLGAEYLRLDNFRTEIMLLDLKIRDLDKAQKKSNMLKAKKRRTLLQNQAIELITHLNKIKSHGNNKEIDV